MPSCEAVGIALTPNVATYEPPPRTRQDWQQPELHSRGEVGGGLRMLTCRAWFAPSSKKRLSLRAARCLLLSLLLSAFTLSATAQENQPSTYEGFEGRNVSKVDIAASPVMNVEAFRSQIKQKPGQPFSIAAIRDSVAALQKTALFSQVQVKVEPEQSGVHVTFLLQPSFYVGMVYFPGAKAFSYTRLLQAANIPDQTPFVQDLVTKGTDALLHLFQEDGYFEAK